MSNIVCRWLRIGLWTKVFAYFPLQDFAMDAFTVDKELVQLLTLPVSRWPLGFTGGLSFSLTGSPTLTVLSWIAIVIPTGRHTEVLGNSDNGTFVPAQKRVWPKKTRKEILEYVQGDDGKDGWSLTGRGVHLGLAAIENLPRDPRQLSCNC